jgi:ATP-dependent helicase HrpB
LQPLPIDSLLGDIESALAASPVLVLEAPPGAGKTTRVPWALLATRGPGEILVSEPRRMAARLAARHVAAERGEKLGGLVGYSVRFENCTGPATRLRYVTDGWLERRLVENPELGGISLVILDEFHERRLAMDVTLAWVRRLQTSSRPDLRLLVMSATLDGERLCRALGDCPRLTSAGKLYPLTIEHLPAPDDRPLDKQVASAVRQLLRDTPDGDLLVFLPGAREIRSATSTLERLATEAGVRVLPLHGELPLAEQLAAVEPGPERKIILSTNVAESSVTIEGVTAVVDSGLERRATHSPWSGLVRLGTAKISRASAAQRAGRAGRMRPGRVVRLYTRGDHDTRPLHELPEILRSDLAETLLGLHGAGVADVTDLPWLDPPPGAAVRAAEDLLTRLGAIDRDRQLTPTGRRMLRLPLAPRLGRLLVEAERRGVSRDACVLVAMLGERDPRLSARPGFGPNQGLRGPASSGDSDLLEFLLTFDEAKNARFEPRRLRALGLDPHATRMIDRARSELERLVRDRNPPVETQDQALGLCVLSGFIDRVARRRQPGQRELILASGDTARLAPESVVTEAALLVAVEVDEKSGSAGEAAVRLASAIEPEWLLEFATETLETRRELLWNPNAERVDEVRSLYFGAVALEEKKSRAAPSREAAEVLWRAARPLLDSHDFGRVEKLVARLELVAEHSPELSAPAFGADAVAEILRRACDGLTTLAELRGVDPTDVLWAGLDGPQRRYLEADVPERIALPGGRRLDVHYERGKAPWVASRLQDFFGMTESPRLCRGMVAVTLHLLAPNQRAVQVTTDLAGFWERHYPEIRRGLMRKYPKHAWPEDGRRAVPPGPPRPRPR